MKKYFLSLYRISNEVVLEIDAFFALSIVPSLSRPNDIGFDSFDFCRSASNLESQIDSFAAAHISMYSASQFEVTTHVCFFYFQDTAQCNQKYRNVVDFRLFLFPF